MRTLAYPRLHLGREGSESAEESNVAFYLKHDFLTDHAAPLPATEAAEPGPGSVRYVQTGGDLSKSGGSLIAPASSTGYGGVGMSFDTGLVRARGLAILTEFVAQAGQHTPAVWKKDITGANDLVPTAAAGARWGMASQPPIANVLNNTSIAYQNLAMPVQDTTYRLCTMLLDPGFALFLDGGLYAWDLIYLSNTGSDSPVYAQMATFSGGASLTTFRVVQLLHPILTSQYGLAFQRFTSLELGQTYIHPADSIFRVVLTTLPSAGSIQLQFRFLNSQNCWYLDINSAGDVKLYEVSGGTTTQRGSTASAAIANGQVIALTMRDTAINVIANSVAAISYTSAASDKTETIGILQSIGTGGAIGAVDIYNVHPVGAVSDTLNEALTR